MPALFAFLHHLAAFGVAAALAVEFVLLKGELNAQRARQLLIADAVYGVCAITVLSAGLLRVFFFEKGASYYFHSLPFLFKFSLFALIGLLSIYPTVQFLSWRKALRQGQAPEIPAARLELLRKLAHAELTLLALLVLCAALMGRGIGILYS